MTFSENFPVLMHLNVKKIKKIRHFFCHAVWRSYWIPLIFYVSVCVYVYVYIREMHKCYMYVCVCVCRKKEVHMIWYEIRRKKEALHLPLNCLLMFDFVVWLMMLQFFYYINLTAVGMLHNLRWHNIFTFITRFFPNFNSLFKYLIIFFFKISLVFYSHT